MFFIRVMLLLLVFASGVITLVSIIALLNDPAFLLSMLFGFAVVIGIIAVLWRRDIRLEKLLRKGSDGAARR